MNKRLLEYEELGNHLAQATDQGASEGPFDLWTRAMMPEPDLDFDQYHYADNS